MIVCYVESYLIEFLFTERVRSPPNSFRIVCRHYTDTGSVAGCSSPSSSSPESICIFVYVYIILVELVARNWFKCCDIVTSDMTVNVYVICLN